MQLRDYLSEQLWSVFDDEGISSVQAALDDLSQALSKYEMIYETIEGEWYVYEYYSLKRSLLLTL